MRRLVCCLTVLTLAGCETPATTPEAPSGPTAPAPDAASLIPPGVGHLENPAFKEMPTPTDMPPLDSAGAEAKAAQVKADYDAAFGAACKPGSGRVLRLLPESTRVGYQAYKNKNLPVAGLFERAAGYAMFGAKAEGRLWIDPNSLNSGDPVRDRKLKKLFFELEQAGNGELGFAVSGIQGELPSAEGASAPVVVAGVLTMHQQKQSIELPLTVKKEGLLFKASLANPVQLLKLADFGFMQAAAALIQSCNHSALGDAVNLQLELAFAEGCKP